jgi:uncharacterized membrane protein
MSGRGWQDATDSDFGMMPDAEAPLFEALILPHRSLSPAALRALLTAVAALCCITSGLFVWLGAWPVGGFTALELLLAGWLIRLHVRSGRATELVLLTYRSLRVVRTDPDGVRRTREMRPAWLSVRLQERPGRVPALLLVGQGQELEIAASLGDAEKRSLADAMAEALRRLRSPVFDNPQLRSPPLP